jgi:hypothetical protein
VGSATAVGCSRSGNYACMHLCGMRRRRIRRRALVLFARRGNRPRRRATGWQRRGVRGSALGATGIHSAAPQSRARTQRKAKRFKSGAALSRALRQRVARPHHADVQKKKKKLKKPAARPAACLRPRSSAASCDHARHKGPGGLVCRCRSMLQLANARRHAMFQHAATPDAVSFQHAASSDSACYLSLLTGNSDFA